MAPPRRVLRGALAVAIAATGGVAALLAASAVVAGREAPTGEPARAARAVPPASMALVYAAGAVDRLEDWPPAADSYEKVRWRASRALGLPDGDGRLVRGVQVPPEGRHFFTWDPIEHRTPNRGWRRFGHDRLVRLTLRVIREHRLANPRAPRVGIGDLSRTRGGDFGSQFGGIGHGSHRNGLDVDIYYPRRDRVERAPSSVAQIDMRLAQDLVDRFVRAGASDVFVGPSTPLTGPPGVVQPLVYHDDHLHVRIPDPD